MTDDRPKPMVEIDGEPILLRMLHALAAAGFKQVAIVTGHRSELIDAFVEANPTGMEVARLRNSHYASTNTVGSFACAAEILQDGFCLLNGDLVFDPSILHDLAACGPGVHLVTDLDEPLGAEEMKVELDQGGCVARISKTLPLELAVGEFTGISRFDATAATLMIDAARRLVEDGRADAYYEDAFNLVGSDFRARMLPTERRAWTEIDDLADYERAVVVVRSVNSASSRP